MSTINEKAAQLVAVLNELSEMLKERDLPKSYAGQMAQFTLREGWIVNPHLLYTLSQRERTKPEDYAQ